MVQALATNNYGPAKLIVATSAANGTHTTLANAMAAASVGDTIFLRDSVTENVTITPGVNIAACQGSTLNTPSITGKLTMTGAGTSTISGIKLVTNSDNFLTVTGSAASIIYLNNCYLNCSNNTGISFTSSSGSANIFTYQCTGDVGTTGIAVFATSSAGTLSFNYSVFTNTGGSSTASTASAGTVGASYCIFQNPITTSSTNSISFIHSRIGTNAQNATCLTVGGSGSNTVSDSFFNSGSASAISIGATLTVSSISIASTNTNGITGAGTLSYGLVNFTSTGNGINVTTRNPYNYNTWTPTLVGASTAGTTTYTFQQGYYTLIGNLVFVEGDITITAATGTGAATIGALPFTVKNLTNYSPIGSAYISGAGWTWSALPRTHMNYQPTPNTTNSAIALSTTAATATLLQMANAACDFHFSAWYQI